MSNMNAKKMPQAETWWTSQETADYLRIEYKTLLNLTSTGQIPYYKFNKKNLYKPSDIMALVKPSSEVTK